MEDTFSWSSSLHRPESRLSRICPIGGGSVLGLLGLDALKALWRIVSRKPSIQKRINRVTASIQDLENQLVKASDLRQQFLMQMKIAIGITFMSVNLLLLKALVKQKRLKFLIDFHFY